MALDIRCHLVCADRPVRQCRLRDVGKAFVVWEEVLPHLEGTLLDAGCLGGFMFEWIRENRKYDYYGVDNWTEAIRTAHKIFPDDKHRFWEADILRADLWPWTFDVIWCAQIVQSDNAACEMWERLLPLANEALIFAHPGEASKLFDLAKRNGAQIRKPIGRFQVVSLWKDKKPQALRA